MFLVLVGCGTHDDKNSLTTQDKAYVHTLRNEVTGVKDKSDKQLVSIGKGACTVASDGYDFVQTTKVISEYGFTDSDSAYIVGAAFAAYCPNEIDKIGR